MIDNLSIFETDVNLIREIKKIVSKERNKRVEFKYMFYNGRFDDSHFKRNKVLLHKINLSTFIIKMMEQSNNFSST